MSISIVAPGAARGLVSRWLWLAFFALGALEAGVYYALPAGTGKVVTSTAVGFLAVLAILVGIRLNRPRPALPWFLIAAGALMFALGDVVWGSYTISGEEAPFPSAADWLYLAGYPLLIAGGVLLLRPLGRAQGRLATIDAAVIAIGFAVPTWAFLIQPFTETGASLESAVLVAYPCADLALVVLLSRLLITPAWRNAAFRLFVAGVGLMLVADIVYYGVGGANEYYAWLDAAYTLVYVCWGAGALHPSMRRLSTELAQGDTRLTPFGVGVMTLAAASVPATLAWGLWGGGEIDAFVFAATTALVLLVLARMAALVRDSERLREEERLARAEAEATQRLLAEQNDRLRELDRAKDEFISLISHDLRTPLTSITGYTELLIEEDDEGPEDRRRFLEIIRRNGDRLLRMVDDLLFLARLQAGKLELEMREADLGQVVEDAVQGLGPRARAQRIELQAEVHGPVRLYADPDRLGQLCDNLVSNALKFTQEGGSVTVRAWSEDGRALLEVSDTGIGIPADEVDRLFDRFFRASSATERQLPGTGLGLTITKAIVDAHGGSVRVTSELGAGTTFRVDLPRVAGAAEASGSGSHGAVTSNGGSSHRLAQPTGPR